MPWSSLRLRTKDVIPVIGVAAVDRPFLEAIEAEAMKLAPQDRADLADRLWQNVNTADAVAAAWDAEIQRRIQQIDAGEVTCRPWDEG